MLMAALGLIRVRGGRSKKEKGQDVEIALDRSQGRECRPYAS